MSYIPPPSILSLNYVRLASALRAPSSASLRSASILGVTKLSSNMYSEFKWIAVGHTYVDKK